MIRHMRHGSPPRLMALQSILSPNRRESLPTPSAGVRITCRGEQGIAFGLNRPDLLEEEFEPVEFPAELRLEVPGQRAAITGPQFLKPGPAMAVHGLVVGYALREQEPLDPVNMLDPLGGQGLALAAEAAPVLLLGRGRLDHRADPRLAALVGQQSSHQRLAVNPVGLGPSPTARGRDRRRVDDMALNALALQHTVEPKAVEPCLLNDDQWKQVTCPGARFRLQRGKERQEPGDSTAAHLVL